MRQDLDAAFVAVGGPLASFACDQGGEFRLYEGEQLYVVNSSGEDSITLTRDYLLIGFGAGHWLKGQEKLEQGMRAESGVRVVVVKLENHLTPVVLEQNGTDSINCTPKTIAYCRSAGAFVKGEAATVTRRDTLGLQ